MKADDLYAKVTADIVAAIEAGAGEWRMPWMQLAQPHISMSTGKPYRGINVWVLNMVAAERGYSSNQWATFKTWMERGTPVRKGQNKANGCGSTEIFLWKTTERKDANDPDKTHKSLYATTFQVFAREQVGDAEGNPLPPIERGLPLHDPIEECERFFAEIGADWRRGGDRAFYAHVQDFIMTPELDQFLTAEEFYSTTAHEHIHWTGHEDRLKRELKNRFGSEAYAMEELTAELGAAFFSAQMGIQQACRKDHASYLASWLRVLKADPKALMTTSSKAQAAIDHLNKLASFEIAPQQLEVV